MRFFSFAFIMVLVQNAASAELSISNNVISWPDDGWYQVQHSDTYEEVCGGGSSCEVPPGTYLVINHTTGQRYTDIFIASESNTLVVEGSTISWPDDGWYQVQTADTFVEVCAGGRSCTVSPGMYNVINHTTGARTEDIEVANVEEAPQESGNRPTVNGNTISWTDDGWYQVQDSETHEQVCAGGRSCAVFSGVYNVINHTTGERFLDIEVTGPTGEGPRVEGNTILLPDDGWYQVQTENTYIEVCGGSAACEVLPGEYVVINHTTGHRYNGIIVEAAPSPEPINLAPTFTGGSNKVTRNDAGAQEFRGWATEMQDNNVEAAQGLVFKVESVSEPSLFATSPSVSYPSGTLRYEPLLGVSGTARISLVLEDDGAGTAGGENTSSSYEFTITIQAASEPVLTPASDLKMVLDGQPVLEQLSSITLKTDVVPDNLRWSVVTEPEGSALDLRVSVRGDSVTFIPYEEGSYTIGIAYGEAIQREVYFSLNPAYPFDITKVDGYEESIDPNSFSGAISNQYWLYSIGSDEAFLRNIAAEYSNLIVLGFDNIQGLLVEIIDEELSSVLLNELRSIFQLDSVEARFHSGILVEKNLDYSLDAVIGVIDGGTNWHLEGVNGINAREAWAISTGHDSVNVGVVEPGYFQSSHVDLNDRVAFENIDIDSEIDVIEGASALLETALCDAVDSYFLVIGGCRQEINRARYQSLTSHGTAVAGVLGADANNSTGLSGINHVSKLHLISNGSDTLPSDLLRDTSVKVINYSWSELPKGESLLRKFSKVYNATRRWRKFAENSSRQDLLHVWAAGNDGVDAAFRNGSIQYDGILIPYEEELNPNAVLELAPAPLDNVMVVGAIGDDGRVLYDYGRSVDIYAPSVFNSPWVTGLGPITNGSLPNDSFTTNFDGTSAAAPVVTGVASLIYSLVQSQGKSITAAEVKSILIDSARKIEFDHVSDAVSAEDSGAIVEDGVRRIKVVDAFGALNETLKRKSLVNPGVPYLISVPNPSEPFLNNSSIVYRIDGGNFGSDTKITLDGNECETRNYTEDRKQLLVVCTMTNSGANVLALIQDEFPGMAPGKQQLEVELYGAMPTVISVEPLIATAGMPEIFTIAGANLPDPIYVELGIPGNCQVIDNSEVEVIVMCTSATAGILSFSVMSEKNGVAISNTSEDVVVSASQAPAMISVVTTVEPLTATVGEAQSFTITGTNLPSTITAFLGRPGTCSIDSLSPIEVVTVCTPVQSGNQNLAISSADAVGALPGTPVSITVSEAVVVPAEPDVTNVEPRTATVGEAQSFTITGTNLPSTITAFLGRPGTCSIDSFSPIEVVTVCTPVQSGNQNLAISSADAVGALPGTPVSITVSEAVVVPAEPDVTNVEPRTATVGEAQSFTITGTNLPSTITAFLGRPGTCSIDSLSPIEVVTVCTPVQSGNQNLAISSADAVGALPGTPVSITVSEAVVVPAEPVVISVSPTTVTEGERVRFEIMGSNFPEDVAVAIWNTSDCAWVSGSESQLLVDCTINSVQPGRPIIRVMVGPNDVNAGGEIFYRDGQPFIADTEEFSGSPIIFVAIDLPVISSVSPLVATVGEEVTFNISGTDLFNTTAVTLGESVSCSYVALSDFQVRAGCIPETAGVQSLTVDGGDIAASITSPFGIEVAEPVTAPVLSGGVNITDITGGFRINSQTATGTVDEYRFYRSTSAGSLGNRISAGTSNSYSDAGLADGTTYYYTIEACNDAGCDSSSQDFKKYVAPVSAPVLSGGVNITDITGGFRINSQTATGTVDEYRFYRSTSAGSLGNRISAGTSNSYSDAGLADGTTYYYTIEACNDAGCDSSSQDFNTYVAPISVPTLSGGVNITDITGGFSINSQTATGLVDEYLFYRFTSDGTVGTLINAGSSNSYNDTGLVDGTTYYYSIAACNRQGCSFSRQDFKTYFASGSLPSVSSISPTQANEGEPTIFTIYGQGLSQQNEVIFNVGSCNDPIAAALDGTSIQVECLPYLEGVRGITVKEQPNGSIISGAELEVEVGPYILDPIIYSATPVSAIIGVATRFEITYRDAFFNLVLEGGTCDNTIRNPGATGIGSRLPSENRNSSIIYCIPGETGTKLLQVVDIINGDVIDGGEFEINVQNNDTPITTEPGQFSDWINFSVYQTEFNRQADIGNYPVTINGRCNNGEPEYRGQFVSERYSQWNSHHHLTESEYSSLRSNLLSEGYRATHEQNILCGGVQRYQGTWVLD